MKLDNLRTEKEITDFLAKSLLITPEQMVAFRMIEKESEAEVVGMYCLLKLSEFALAKAGYSVSAYAIAKESDKLAHLLELS